MLPSTVHVYPACIGLLADDPSLELSRKLQWKGLLRLGNLHEFHVQIPYLARRRKNSRLTARPSECICTYVLASQGGASVKLQKWLRRFPAWDKSFLV